MIHFVTRFCTQFVPRLSSGIRYTLNQKTVIGSINSNKYVPHSVICCTPKWMSSSAHSETQAEEQGEKVKIYFKMPRTGELVEATAREGQTVMNVAVSHEISMEGACEGAICCTTCHVYVQDDLFDRLPEPVQAEEDMIDSAPFHKLTSRLSCQIVVTKDMEGAIFELPLGTQNMQIDKNHRGR
ncbi:ferredoxin-2, mitochondrial-like [Argiope bruennichi]|uniref:ferredoxin-2, mitochondrial-like n=1 Tax=Argiope bruennichi TaxID=94029 RepID=UPI002494FBDE|nr:ferredoxin-2, mitochondrial-like [Argiope bruennichi]